MKNFRRTSQYKKMVMLISNTLNAYVLETDLLNGKSNSGQIFDVMAVNHCTKYGLQKKRRVYCTKNEKMMSWFLVSLLMFKRIMGFFITTPLFQGQSNAGQMFDVVALTPIAIDGFAIHISDLNANVNVSIYRLNTFGSFVGHENNPNDWTLIHERTVMGKGRGVYVSIGYLVGNNQTLVPKLQKQAFYIQISGSTLEYNETNNLKTGDLLTANEDIQVYVGISNNNNFGNYSLNKPFVGKIYYADQQCDTVIWINGLIYGA